MSEFNARARALEIIPHRFGEIRLARGSSIRSVLILKPPLRNAPQLLAVTHTHTLSDFPPKTVGEAEERG